MVRSTGRRRGVDAVASASNRTFRALISLSFLPTSTRVLEHEYERFRDDKRVPLLNCRRVRHNRVFKGLRS
jgi:hypothetical protein